MAVTLARSDEGDQGAPAIILLHGSPTDREVWAPQVAELVAEGLRVIRPDLRGHGQSPLGEGPATLDAMAGDVFALADELHLSSFIVGGFSFGGWVSMQMVREKPARVAGLLLVSTGARPDTPKERVARPQQAAQLRRTGLNVDGYRDRVLTAATLRDRQDVWEKARATMSAVSVEGRARAVEGMATRPDFRASLKAVTAPTLVIGGAEDPITPPELSRELHALIPGSFLQIVEGASHLVTLEAPGIVSQSVANWLQWSGLPK